MRALGSIGGSKEAAEAVAKLLLDPDDRSSAVSALRKMGPVAEDAVWPHIESTDTLLQSYVGELLRSIGTQKSVARLQALLKKKSAVDRTTIVITLEGIQRRLAKK
jgi:HEAT repeat protein